VREDVVGHHHPARGQPEQGQEPLVVLLLAIDEDELERVVSREHPARVGENEVDPIAEADVYMAYGRDAQAEEILKEALQKDSSRTAVHAKLLEIYAKRKDKTAFEQTAVKLKSLTNGAGPEWEKAAALGKSMDPTNGLYAGAAAAAAAVAAPAAAAAAPAAPAPALDFDIGGALQASPPEVFLWSDSGDVLSTDPYPLVGAEPAGGYAHRLVADWTAVSRDAVMDARPFMTVLQFFKFLAAGRWPTLAEMRNHAYMAIVEGARGLMWWSLGANGLRDVCSGWCDEKLGYMSNLKSLVGELADLEPALLADDTPAALAGNSLSTAIRTKVKTLAGKGYLFAYNRTSASVTATFTWHRAPSRITVHAENRTLTPSGATSLKRIVLFGSVKIASLTWCVFEP